MSGEYGGWGRTFECFCEVGFDRRRNMWSSIIMQENNFVMPGVVMSAFFLECSAQSH